jgi:spermidine synthase
LACLLVWAAEERILYEGYSLYRYIRVSESEGSRYLTFNRTRGIQSAVSIRDPLELKLPYTRASFVVPAFTDYTPERILFVGLGGGSIPRVMAKIYPKSRIDIVEIDPDVIKVAKKFFFFEPTPMMNITVMDGRRFLRRSTDFYDIIFLDAYDDISIPFHLTTREFFEIVKARLTPYGLVASNIWGPRNDEFYLSEVKTFQNVFPHVYMIDAISSSNYIIIAHSHEKDMTKTLIEERIPALQRKFEFNFSLMRFARTFEDLSGVSYNARVLIDDFAPVEILRSRKVSSE